MTLLQLLKERYENQLEQIGTLISDMAKAILQPLSLQEAYDFFDMEPEKQIDYVIGEFNREELKTGIASILSTSNEIDLSNYDMDISLNEIIDYKKWDIYSAILDAIMPKITRNEVEKLKTIKDDINNETEVKFHYLDEFNREKPFLFLNGTIYEGEKGETHTQMINKYFKISRSKDDQIDRLTNKEREELEFTNYFFGHMVDNIAFVDTEDKGPESNLTTCINALKDKNALKVYTIPESKENGYFVTRLARKISQKGIHYV